METNSKQTVAAGVNLQACPACFVCKKQVADSQWFCRLTQKPTDTPLSEAAKILLCSPTCALSYFGQSQPNGSGLEPVHNGKARSPRVAAGGQRTESSQTATSETSRKDQ